MPPFSANLVSMSMTIKRRAPAVEAAASEAGGSPRQPLGGDETPMGGEEEGKAQSHWGAAGSSRAKCRCVEAGWVEVGGEGMGTQKADGAGLSADPGGPTGGLLSSASLA